MSQGWVEVTTWTSEIDGATVVQIDTSPSTGHLRIVLNEYTCWDADPETYDSPIPTT